MNSHSIPIHNRGEKGNFDLAKGPFSPLFFSSDYKIPLAAAEAKLEKELKRLLKLGAVAADRIVSLLEIEQEYFLADSTSRFNQEIETSALQLGMKSIGSGHHALITSPQTTSLAIDQNAILMEFLVQTALKHNLVCLFNASGKRLFWSFADLQFPLLPIFMTAVFHAFHENESLFQASIATKGHELRAEDWTLLSTAALRPLMGELPLPLKAFFGFAGNKLEFRAPGASLHCGLCMLVIQAMIADSLRLILDEINDCVQDQQLVGASLLNAALPVLHKHLEKIEEPRIQKSFSTFVSFVNKKSIRLFEEILTENDLQKGYENLVIQHVKMLEEELHLMMELFHTEILPLSKRGIKLNEAIALFAELKNKQDQLRDLGWEAKGKVFCELIVPKMEEMRRRIDELKGAL